MYVELNGARYCNNSVVMITDIGIDDEESLLCVTNTDDCCRGMAAGEWYFPNNGSAVGIEGGGGDFYRNRGLRVVRLHRRNNAMSPTGAFCCEIPGINGTNHRLCVTVSATTGKATLIYKGFHS